MKSKSTCICSNRRTFNKAIFSFYYQHNPQRLSTCPLSIHALLHIIDGIIWTGPVWVSWAFPTERFCGHLLPAIQSRRFPYPSIDRFVLHDAQLCLAKIRLNLHTELSLTSSDSPEGFRHVDCEYIKQRYLASSLLRGIMPTDPRCVLLPRRRTIAMSKLETGLCSKITASLSTRFDVPMRIIKRHLPQFVQEFGRVRIDQGGDTICTTKLASIGADSRDASFVRVRFFLAHFTKLY